VIARRPPPPDSVSLVRPARRLASTLAAGAILACAAAALASAPAALAAGPTATTGQITEESELHFDRVKLSGTVNPEGTELEECLFEYGETESLGQAKACGQGPSAIGSGTSEVPVTAKVTGLTPGTHYYFRLTAKSSTGTAHGSLQQFTTLGAPAWKLSVKPAGESVIPGPKTKTLFTVEAENVGGDESEGTVTIENTPPAGLPASTPSFRWNSSFFGGFNLASFGFCSGGTCSFPGFLVFFGVKGVKPGEKLVMSVFVEPEGTEGQLEDSARVSGGGAPTAEASGTIDSTSQPSFGHLGFEASLTQASGQPYTQAGGHPYQFTTDFSFATLSCVNPEFEGSAVFAATCPLYDPRNITGLLPPGLVVNPQAVPRCTLAEYFSQSCNFIKNSVGTLQLRPYGMGSSAFKYMEPVVNLEPSGEYPGQLGATVGGLPFIVITSGLRDGSHYEIAATTTAIQTGLNHTRLTLWGVPADPGHDVFRGKFCEDMGGPENPSGYHGVVERFLDRQTLERYCENSTPERPGGGPAETPEAPFITMPTECSGDPLTVTGKYDTWQLPGLWAEETSQLEAVEGCNALTFEPTIEARPTTNLADAPSGLEFNLNVPQDEEAQGVATPELKEAVVKLPAGIRINPAAANGRRGCSEAQANLHVEAPSACPDAAKIGEAEVISSLLHEPLKGSLFLAIPHQNPFGALLAGYLSVEGQGIRIKVPGVFETDPQTGQITTRFPDNPQLPFEELKLKIFGGALGALRTPTTCGRYQTTTSLTPFSAPESGPPETPSSSFETTEAEHGGACPTAEGQEPSAPRFAAGTETPQAGAFSPFSLKLVREDGSQELSKIETTLPPGLSGRLAGIPYCPQAGIERARSREHEGGGAQEQADPSCPAASEVGSLDIGAGAGPDPIHVTGHAYLAGPYKGAPLSVAIVTPALAGPFDLGTVVVRAALYVNPETAQITARSDQIPHILQGIPLDIRSIAMRLSRHDFTLNPTNCEELGFTGAATSVLGQLTSLSERFQVGGCAALPFKPHLSLRLSGATHRAGNPALRAVLTMPPGDANVASAQVALPHTELLDNAHIRNTCSRAQFASSGCPPGSAIGFAKAETPLLEAPLEGPVYLMTGFGHTLPDLAADLNGQIRVLLHGKVDTGPGGGIRNTFEVVPDAPVSKFTLSLDGGGKGLLENSTNLCAGPQRAAALFNGQNASSVQLSPLLKVRCAKHRRHHGRAHRGAGR
jgi:hypothetical protein